MVPPWLRAALQPVEEAGRQLSEDLAEQLEPPLRVSAGDRQVGRRGEDLEALPLEQRSGPEEMLRFRHQEDPADAMAAELHRRPRGLLLGRLPGYREHGRPID